MARPKMYLAHPGQPERTGGFHPELSDLPETIPLFPIAGAVVLPNSDLPLNVFEPRYLAMSRFALGTRQRLIGMVQPASGNGTDDEKSGDKNESGGASGSGWEPRLEDFRRVGCAGRIVSFAETTDGRYIIVLRGVCRFRLAEAPRADSLGFVRARALWSPYALDLQAPVDSPPDMAGLRDLTIKYLDSREMRAGDAFGEEMTAEDFVNTAAMLCPFSGAEKQALLEAEDIGRRAEALRAIMTMSVRGGNGGGAAH